MPPLHHTLPGQAFDMDKSEVVKWIMAQPDFKNWLFNRAACTRRIVYDPATGTWSGHPRDGKPGRPSRVELDEEEPSISA